MRRFALAHGEHKSSGFEQGVNSIADLRAASLSRC
jgi:hypothetical protein